MHQHTDHRPAHNKKLLLSQSEIDDPPSNFTGTTIQCISIDWYPEINTFESFTAVNSTISLKKATDWSGTYLKVNSSKETMPSLNHAINTKHVQVLVKFERSISIQFRRKKWHKTFSNGMAQPFFFFGKERFISQNWDRQPAFKFSRYLDVLCIYCIIPRNMHLDVEWSMNASISLEKRQIGVVSKTASHQRKSGFLGISR
jgi:hypothetical protein